MVGRTFLPFNKPHNCFPWCDSREWKFNWIFFESIPFSSKVIKLKFDFASIGKFPSGYEILINRQFNFFVSFLVVFLKIIKTIINFLLFPRSTQQLSDIRKANETLLFDKLLNRIKHGKRGNWRRNFSS